MGSGALVSVKSVPSLSKYAPEKTFYGKTVRDPAQRAGSITNIYNFVEPKSFVCKLLKQHAGN